jgi:hypothetical protein
VSGIGWYQTQATLRSKIAEQLAGIRTTKAEQFESYFENLNNQVGMLASDGNVVKAMVELNAGFRNLERNVIPPEWDTALMLTTPSNFSLDCKRIYSLKP